MSVQLEPGALVLKDPSSIEPFGLDWTAWLAEIAANELITASTWAVTGPDTVLVIDDDSVVTGSLQSQVILSGGTVGQRYTLTNLITTTQGFEDERSFHVKVEHR